MRGARGGFFCSHPSALLKEGEGRRKAALTTSVKEGSYASKTAPHPHPHPRDRAGVKIFRATRNE